MREGGHLDSTVLRLREGGSGGCQEAAGREEQSSNQRGERKRLWVLYPPAGLHQGRSVGLLWHRAAEVKAGQSQVPGPRLMSGADSWISNRCERKSQASSQTMSL